MILNYKTTKKFNYTNFSFLLFIGFVVYLFVSIQFKYYDDIVFTNLNTDNTNTIQILYNNPMFISLNDDDEQLPPATN